MNDENLKPLGSGKRSPGEEHAIHQKGGIASAAARRRRRAWKDKVQAMLAEKAPVEDAETLTAYGIDADAAWEDVILAALIRKAADGNVQAITTLAEITGNDPTLKLKQAEMRLKRETLRERKREFDLTRGDRSDEAIDWGAMVEQAYQYDAAREISE